MKRTWDQHWITLAHEFAKKSKDPSTKVGCVVVGEGNVALSWGFNGFPRNVIETEKEWNKQKGVWVQNDLEIPAEPFDRWNRPQKYTWVEHAERNACHNAARAGIKLLGATAYLNWDPIPCVECTKAFIQSGISYVVGPNNRSFKARPNASNMDYQFDTSVAMLKEAGVTIREIDMEDYIFS